MSQETKHSPLPWNFKYSDNATPHILHSDGIYIEDRDKLVLAMPAEITQSYNSTANAKFIVRACNSHYELVSCLKSLLHTKRYGNGLQAWWDLEKRCETAIAEAEGK